VYDSVSPSEVRIGVTSPAVGYNETPNQPPDVPAAANTITELSGVQLNESPEAPAAANTTTELNGMQFSESPDVPAATNTITDLSGVQLSEQPGVSATLITRRQVCRCMHRSLSEPLARGLQPHESLASGLQLDETTASGLILAFPRTNDQVPMVLHSGFK
jgi:hypothetical protein